MEYMCWRQTKVRIMMLALMMYLQLNDLTALLVMVMRCEADKYHHWNYHLQYALLVRRMQHEEDRNDLLSDCLMIRRRAAHAAADDCVSAVDNAADAVEWEMLSSVRWVMHLIDVYFVDVVLIWTDDSSC